MVAAINDKRVKGVSESRNCGLCVVYIQKYGATLLVGAWQREKKRE